MRRPTLWLAVVLLGLLGAMAAKSWLIELPAVRSDNVPDQFDAERAAGRLAFILADRRPHPADTPADDLVRSKIVSLLQSMGLTPIVRDQVACNELYKQRGVSCARVRNVVALLGPPTGKAVLLNAHYDSSGAGPGAGDDGVGVATLLEVGAILKDKPLKRPVILLFNEGEELGLVGARAFLADPLSRNVDSLINLEARGVRGPANMFETSRPNAPAIAVFAKAVDHPVANSLSTDVYRLLSNYTDVNSFTERGWMTLNIAPIGNETRYHSAGDDLAALDLRTLQHMGDQTLALAGSLANGGPPRASGERIFMDVSGRALISLPLVVGVVLIVALLIAFAILAFRRGRLVRGLTLAFGTLLGSTAVAWVALAAIGAARNGMFWRAEPVWTHLATYASAMLVAALLLATIGARADRTQLRAAFWLVFLLLGGAIGLVAAGGIIFFLFPPLTMLMGIGARRWWQPAERLASALAILFLYLTWGAMLALLEELLNGGPMWIFAPPVSLLILPALIETAPLIRAAGWRWSAALAGVLTLAGWAAAAAVPAYSADRQQRFVIQHVTDLRTFKARWSVLNDVAPLPTGFGNGWKRGKLPFSDRPRWIAPAPADARIAAAPGVQRLFEVKNGKQRILTLRFLAAGFDGIQLVAPANARIRAAGTAGFVRPIDSTGEPGRYAISCFGRYCDGLNFQLIIGKPDPVDVLVLGSQSGLPPSAAPLIAARPRFARPQYNRDETIAMRRATL